MYTYEKFNFRPLPVLLIIISIVFLFTDMYIQGGIIGTIGALFIFSFKGISLDSKKHQIRQFDRFLWFYFGAWKSYSKPLYVSVVSIKLSSKRTAASPMVGPAPGKDIRSYKLNLIVEGKERYVPILRGKKELLLKEGLIIARLLKIKLLDHTTSEKHWLS